MIYCRLNILLEERNLSKSMFSQITGIRPNTICALAENKGINVRKDVVDMICKTLHCSVSDVFVFIPENIK